MMKKWEKQVEKYKAEEAETEADGENEDSDASKE